ncbi:MAG: hypothetical protein ACREJX_17830, partial [Polyangiaceae bacterium]
LLGIAAISMIDAGALEALGPAGRDRELGIQKIFVWGAYTGLFTLFITGLVTWLRSRDNTPWIARLIAIAILFLICALPWVIVAIGDAASTSSGSIDDWENVGAPSPFFAFYMIGALDKLDPGSAIEVGFGAAMVWGFIGFGLLAAAGRRCARAISRYEVSLEQADAAFRHEDEALASQNDASTDAQPAATETAPAAT